MKQIPMLFSTPMVIGLQDGIKTETRRTRNLELINEDPDDWKFVDIISHIKWGTCARFIQISTRTPVDIKIPYGQSGDIIWVRETWCNAIDEEVDYLYKAVHPNAWSPDTGASPWRPSIHMPKAAARIWLNILSVTIERLHDIDERGAINEGVYFDKDSGGWFTGDSELLSMHTAINAYSNLWCNINGPASWDANPWVWVVKFSKKTDTNK